MTQSTLLFAYEINAQIAKTMLQKKAGISAKFKKFKASEIVEHVTKCWEELEYLFKSQNISPSDKILYTVQLQDPLRIGKESNNIINNAFLMSVISDDTRIGREAIAGARFYQYSDNSDFEKSQFSILLEELKGKYSTQEVGIFGWVNITSDSIDSKIKKIAVEFSQQNNGELHFIEISDDGQIFPNFSNVSSQKFEGKLAGNYSITLSLNDYKDGIRRLNNITNTVVRKKAINVSDEVQPRVKNIVNMEESLKNRKSYSDEFKQEVAKSAQEDGATLASVGEKYGVSPTLVRNWKAKFLNDGGDAQTTIDKKPNIDISALQNWLQGALVTGTIDSDGDLYVSLETSDDALNDDPEKLFLIGKQKLSSGSSSEVFDFCSEIATNEVNWFRSDFLKSISKDSMQFSLNLMCEVRARSSGVVVPLKLKAGKVSECPIRVGNIEMSNLHFIVDENGSRAEGTLKGPSGFVYSAEILTSEPEEGHSTAINKVMDDEYTTEFYEYLWDANEGDTVYLIFNAFEKSIGHLTCDYTGTAQIEEPFQNENNEDEFENSCLEDVETDEGAVGLFEFQLKRGYVSVDEIEDDEIRELAENLKELCEGEEFEAASKLLMTSLSFEFGPDELDDEPEKYFSDLNYIEFECTNDNTSVKVGVDGEGSLLVTISVQFEIALNSGISTRELEEYLPGSGAWAAASVSPGWSYYESDGENVRFLGLKSDGGSNDEGVTPVLVPSRDGFEGTVVAVSIVRAEKINDFDNISANNGSIDGPELRFYLIYDADDCEYHALLEGSYHAHTSEEIYDYEAAKEALKGLRPTLMEELSLNGEEVDYLLHYIVANSSDEADDIDSSEFTHIWTELGEVDGNKYFSDEEDAMLRIWIATSQNLTYTNISIDPALKTLEFDEECLDEKQIVSWSKFKLNLRSEAAAKMTVLDLTDQPIGSVEFKIEVASACADSGMSYIEFAKLYNLNADELNAWAMEFLGAKLG